MFPVKKGADANRYKRINLMRFIRSNYIDERVVSYDAPFFARSLECDAFDGRKKL